MELSVQNMMRAICLQSSLALHKSLLLELFVHHVIHNCEKYYNLMCETEREKSIVSEVTRLPS